MRRRQRPLFSPALARAVEEGELRFVDALQVRAAVAAARPFGRRRRDRPWLVLGLCLCLVVLGVLLLGGR